MRQIDQEAMDIAIKESKFNENNNYNEGGPFGCAIVKDNQIISTGHNSVILSKDPTAHAEVNAIRKACQKLGTHNLEGCIIYTSAEPCPMCLSAIIWANIKEVYYANTKESVDDIGFRDDIIYDYLKGNNNSFIKLNHVDREDAKKIFEDFKNNKDKETY